VTWRLSQAKVRALDLGVVQQVFTATSFDHLPRFEDVAALRDGEHLLFAAAQRVGGLWAQDSELA